MTKENFFCLFQSHYLFAGLSAEEINDILIVSKEIAVPKGTVIVREGESDTHIYLLAQGKVEILKREESSGAEQQITALGAGEIIGEMAFLDSSPRSATVRTLEDSVFLVLPDLSQHQEKNFPQIVHNICKNLTKRLRHTDEVTVKALQAELFGAKIRVEMGRFLLNMLLLLASWIVAIGAVKQYLSGVANNTFVSVPLVAAIMLVCINHVKRSIYPLSFYGLSTKNWKRYSFEAVYYSIPFLLLIFFIKWILIKTVPVFYDDPLIYPTLIIPNSPLSASIQLLLCGVYVLFVPFQEFASRGTLQSTLRIFLSVKHKDLWGIVVSNLIFAAFHTHVSLTFACVAFITGCFWGWLYTRQESLVGPIVSHSLIGVISLNLFGFSRILPLL
jgi:CRP-like cAMP-binding protein/membrane protease YdiL (CAAX protease family)